MKTLRNLLIIVLMVFMTICATAQDRVSLVIYQDAKLLVSGDNKGNSAGTLNILSQFKMQGNQQKWGYMVVYPEFEYANLKEVSYMRYTANVGYVFNKLILNNFEAGIYGGWGWIKRGNLTYSSASVTGNINYKLNNTFKLTVAAQITDRTDIGIIRVSGFVGFEINLN